MIDPELKNILQEIKEGQKLLEEKISKSLYVIEKKVDNLNNKVDIIIKVNELRQSVDI